MIHNQIYITPDHLSRSAVVYVRQSCPGQVRDNPESTRVQLSLREKAICLGWKRPSVIDEDLGLSAAGLTTRPGFQQLLTRVAMKEVGIILCVEASRLSRNSKDWAHLFELCSYFNTLIADLDQVYNLQQPNDRLLMGIKGTISEMELSVLRARMHTGIQIKAERGELRLNLPTGYDYDPEGKIVKDPDRRVRDAIERLFDRFDRSTSLRQLTLWYRDTNRLFPVRRGRWGTATHWDLPSPSTLRNVFQNPTYAGAYVWGRRSVQVEYVEGHLVKRVRAKKPVKAARACIHDHHPAYITWDRFLENLAKISENRPRWIMQQNRGAIREGIALLTGLLRCAQCGSKIRVGYKAENALYYCDGGHMKGTKRCFSFGSTRIDQCIVTELLNAVSSLGVKAAVTAAEEKRARESKAFEEARLQVEAAQYEADRAFEQFDQCDPKNRLVADTLEERLNEKLMGLKETREKLEALSASNPEVTAQQQKKLEELSRDFPAVWNHPAVDPKLKKRLLRAAIHEILVKHEPEQQRLEVTIHWQGGAHSRIHVPKRAENRFKKAPPSLVNLVRDLAAEVPDADIARILNMQRIPTPIGLRWTLDRVVMFRRHHGIHMGKLKKDPNVLSMSEAIEFLGIGHNGLLGLVKLGAVSTNQITEYAPWKVSRAELESDRVRRLVKVLKETGRLPRGGSPENQLTIFDEKH